MTKAIDLRKKPLLLLLNGVETAIELPIKRSTAKDLSPLVADLYGRWIRCSLDLAELIADDSAWEVITKLSSFFTASGQPLDPEALAPEEIEALFLTQNRTESVASKDGSENYELRAYEMSGLVSVRLVDIDYFVPGLLIEMASLNGQNIFLQQHSAYLKSFQDEPEEKEEVEPVTKTRKAPKVTEAVIDTKAVAAQAA
jgi:hypothetical protein